VNRNRVFWSSAALVVALLAFGPAVALVAQQMPEQPAGTEETTLTGKLNRDDQGGFVLIEQESGDSVPLQGPADLATYVGSTVKVTGMWSEDSAGKRHFKVSKVERSS
jgi:hypothetical protein